jgi:hypothetical protein
VKFFGEEKLGVATKKTINNKVVCHMTDSKKTRETKKAIKKYKVDFFVFPRFEAKKKFIVDR